MHAGKSLTEWFTEQSTPRPTGDTAYAVELVAAILTLARRAGASDVHLIPREEGLVMDWRIDGVLHRISRFPSEVAPRVIARLKVLAQLLTYQTEVPQEGRIAQTDQPVEMRLSVFPTLFGEKAVIRLLGERQEFPSLDSLGLGADLVAPFREALQATSGCIIVCGPAGSGKTTTLYAAMREIADKSDGARSLVSLEDPIEAVLPHVSQSQVHLTAGFTLPVGLRSLMRQDPEVIMVGEIRDREAAEIVFQAALTGHLVLTTFHAASAAGAVSRLSDMGIEPYVLRSGLRGVMSQRLLRRLCECGAMVRVMDTGHAWQIEQSREPVGCERCQQRGYSGRIVAGEWLPLESTAVSRGILLKADAQQIEQQAVDAGMRTLRDRVRLEIQQGHTSLTEAQRILGWSG